MANLSLEDKVAELNAKECKHGYLLHQLCPALSYFQPYGFKFVLDEKKSLKPRIYSWLQVIQRSLLFVTFIYTAHFFYRYWKVSYKDNNQTGICHSTVVGVLLITATGAFISLCSYENQIARFIVSVADLAEAQLTPEDNEQFLFNARKYGKKLAMMPPIISAIKMIEGFYQVASQVTFVNDVIHGTYKNNATGIQNLERVIEVDYVDDPYLVAIYGSIRVIFFNGICEHFTLLFMAMVAQCCYIVSFSFPAQPLQPVSPEILDDDEDEDVFKPKIYPDETQISLAKSTDKMLIFQKQHNNITFLIKSGDNIFSPMFFIWMIFLMTGICFSVRGLKNNLTEARNVPVLFLIILHFCLYLALISVAGNLNSQVQISMSTFPGSMDAELGAAMYLKQTQAAVESTVLYINNFFSQPIGITVWGFFIIEPDLAFSLLGTVFSYSVVMYCLK